MTYRVPTVVTGTAGTATGNIEITRPTALRAGDLLVLVVSSQGDASGMTPPDGFTAVVAEINQGEINFAAWYKFAANNEPATYDVTFGAEDVCLYNLFIVRGADPFTVIDITDQAAGNAVLPRAEPGVTTTVDNCLAVACLAYDDAPRALVQPEGWTLHESRNGANDTLSHAICYKTIESAGASGSGNWTATDSSAGDYAAVTFAIRPGCMSLANSIIYEPQQLLAKTLADCSEFRNLTGTSSHAAAQARIWHESLPPPENGRDVYSLEEMETYRPFALIFTNDVDGAMADRQASSPAAWSDRGSLRILLELDTPDLFVDSPVLLDQLMKQLLGRIAKRPSDESSSTFFGLMDLAHRTNETGGYSYLAIDNVAFRGWHRSHQREQPGQGDFLVAWLEVQYGQRGA